MMKYRLLSLALLGIALTLAGTVMHPMDEPPGEPALAFVEYAADRLWLYSHLLQLGGFAAMILGIVALAFDGKWRRSSTVARASGVAASAGLALAAGLQAVDGVALKAMVDLWAAAPAAEKSSLFNAALAVRQIEVGLAAMLSIMLGFAIVLFGIAQSDGARFPRWQGLLGIVTGILTVAGGFAMAKTGFSDMAMNINMIGLVAAAVWLPVTAWTADRQS